MKQLYPCKEFSSRFYCMPNYYFSLSKFYTSFKNNWINRDSLIKFSLNKLIQLLFVIAVVFDF